MKYDNNTPVKETEGTSTKNNRTSSSDKKSSPIQTVLDIWNVLAEHASPEKPLTISQIGDILENSRAMLSGSPAHRGNYGYTAEEAKIISSYNSAKGHLPTSKKTVQRYMPQDIDAMNALTPHTVICESGTPTILHAYPVEDTLHIVVEDPDGNAKYEGDATVLLRPSATMPIPEKTLHRKLPTLMEQFDEASRQFKKRPPMLSLSGVIQKNGKYLPALDHTPAEKETTAPSKPLTKDDFKRDGRSPTRRYYLKSILTSAEWQIFHDLICVYPYIDERQTQKFLSVLRRIAPGTQQWPTERYAPKADASLQFSHIATLDQAIENCRKVTLTSGLYLLDQDQNNKLRPVLRQRIDFSKKEKKLPFVHVVEPYALIWSNGYYYLIAKTDSGMRNFRLDRILSVQLLQETFERNKDFDPYEYRDQSPVMHSGKPVYVRIRCPISLLGTALDVFGSSIKDYSPRHSLPGSEGKKNYTEISLWSSEEGARLFAMEYADQVEVLEPKSLRNAVADSLRAALKKYE